MNTESRQSVLCLKTPNFIPPIKLFNAIEFIITMIKIDGSKGEGGGQIIRSSLCLSAITGKPVSLFNIRAGRKKPGLLRQHLTAVQAAKTICRAKVTGAELNSSELTFRPGQLRGGDFHFQIGSAGSATLVAQTVLPALMTTEEASTLRVEGGTHNPKAPCFDYLAKVFLPLIQQMGPRFETQLDSHGFYPAGGGSFQLKIHPTTELAPLEVLNRDNRITPRITAIVSNIPKSVGERECETIAKKTDWDASCFEVVEVPNPRGPGNVVMIELISNQLSEMFTGFGAVGVRAEQIARSTLKMARNYIALADIPVGLHLADQLMLPMGLAALQGKTSRFKTMPLTPHSKTNMDVLQRFLDIEFATEESDNSVMVTVMPRD